MLNQPPLEIKGAFRYPEPPSGFVNIPVDLSNNDCPCCAGYGLLNRDDRQRAPVVLLENGLTDELWHHWDGRRMDQGASRSSKLLLGMPPRDSYRIRVRLLPLVRQK